MPVQPNFKAVSCTSRICKLLHEPRSNSRNGWGDSVSAKFIHGSLYVLVDPVIRRMAQKFIVEGSDSVDGDCDLLNESEPKKPCEVEKHRVKCKALMVLRLTCEELEETATSQLFRTVLPYVVLGILAKYS